MTPPRLSSLEVRSSSPWWRHSCKPFRQRIVRWNSISSWLRLVVFQKLSVIVEVFLRHHGILLLMSLMEPYLLTSPSCLYHSLLRISHLQQLSVSRNPHLLSRLESTLLIVSFGLKRTRSPISRAFMTRTLWIMWQVIFAGSYSRSMTLSRAQSNYSEVRYAVWPRTIKVKHSSVWNHTIPTILVGSLSQVRNFHVTWKNAKLSFLTNFLSLCISRECEANCWHWWRTNDNTAHRSLWITQESAV